MNATSDKGRIAVAGLAASAALFAALLSSEGFTEKAIQPVPGDKWTYGFGSTEKADGSPVKPTDTIKPPEAARLAASKLQGKERTLRSCFQGSFLTQGEWDSLVDLSYNVGPAAVCRSSLPSKARAGQYEAMCKTTLDFKRVQGRDCSLPANKRFCGGVWARRLRMYEICIGGWPDV